MNILYWNVCSEADNQRIFDETADLIALHNIDVACLQEVPYETSKFTDPSMEPIAVSELLAQELGAASVFEHTRTIPSKKNEFRGYGTAILSFAGIRDASTNTLRSDSLAYMTPHPSNRRVLTSVITEEEPHISVGVAHLSYALPFGIGKGRALQEIDTLAGVLKVQTEDNEAVFGGDFNAKPNTAVDKKLAAIGLRGIVDTSVPTFRSRHWFAGYISRNLDRVYVSRALEATATIVRPRQSDHTPIIVATV